MLAESRRKQKWSLNPRGTLWSSDSNKLGQRLLEKMGWKAGCGLGANLQGPTEHVRVSVKNDNRGVGFKGRAEDVLEHQMNFSKLLEELNGGVKEEVKINSLEHQSQQSRARVHYRKFTRGKDLSRCSDKDLQCILGKKVNEDKAEQNYFDKQESTQNFGVLTINGGNSDEYFQNKRGNKLDSKAKKDCVRESSIQEDLMWKSKKRKTKKKNSSGVSETKESEIFGDNLTTADEVRTPIADTSHNLNKSKEYKKKFKSRVQEFVSQIELEHEETQGENFSTCCVENNREQNRVNDSERLENVTDREVGSRKKHKLDRRKDKKRKVPEIKLSEDEVQDVAVKKKRKENKTCNLSVAVEDDLSTVMKPDENGDFDDITVPKTYDHLCLIDNSEQNTVYKKKSKKKKRKVSEKEFETCENEEPGGEEMGKVTTGIRKGPAVTDLGFKGSNIMRIKGYGVA